MTITVSDEVYQRLHSKIGPRRISRFLDSLARPHVLDNDLDTAYKSMAADRQRERAALEWNENLVGDSSDETR